MLCKQHPLKIVVHLCCKCYFKRAAGCFLAAHPCVVFNVRVFTLYKNTALSLQQWEERTQYKCCHSVQYLYTFVIRLVMYNTGSFSNNTRGIVFAEKFREDHFIVYECLRTLIVSFNVTN